MREPYLSIYSSCGSCSQSHADTEHDVEEVLVTENIKCDNAEEHQGNVEKSSPGKQITFW